MFTDCIFMILSEMLYLYLLFSFIVLAYFSYLLCVRLLDP